MSEKKEIKEEEIKKVAGGGLGENVPERWCSICKKMTKQKMKTEGNALVVVCSVCDHPYWEGNEF